MQEIRELSIKDKNNFHVNGKVSYGPMIARNQEATKQSPRNSDTCSQIGHPLAE